jgi:hypothetical protein
MFVVMLIGSFGESACRPDKSENGGFDWWGKFSPSRDYLRQVGTGRD